MKKIWILALTFVLTAALFTGCGCTNSNKNNASTPTGMTEPMQTVPPTQATTVPTTQPTRPTIVETTPTGNGILEDSATDSTAASDSTESTLETRSRGTIPGNSSKNSNNGR